MFGEQALSNLNSRGQGRAAGFRGRARLTCGSAGGPGSGAEDRGAAEGGDTGRNGTEGAPPHYSLRDETRGSDPEGISEATVEHLVAESERRESYTRAKASENGMTDASTVTQAEKWVCKRQPCIILDTLQGPWDTQVGSEEN